MEIVATILVAIINSVKRKMIIAPVKFVQYLPDVEIGMLYPAELSSDSIYFRLFFFLISKPLRRAIANTSKVSV